MHILVKKMLMIKFNAVIIAKGFIRCARVTLNKWLIVGGLNYCWIMKMMFRNNRKLEQTLFLSFFSYYKKQPPKVCYKKWYS